VKNRRIKNAQALALVLLLAVGAGGAWFWWQGRQETPPDDLVSGNGRIEANQVDIAAKSAGRVRDMPVREGDLVSVGQVLARLDITELQAQRARMVADQTAEEASVQVAISTVAQRRAEFALKEANHRRTHELVDTGYVSRQTLDQAQSERDAAGAALDAAERNVTARQRSVQAARALVEQVDAQIGDTHLRSPVKGRVLYRLANPGEVVSAGGKILTLVDLSEIYMEIYLPAAQAMRVPIGSQARIQIDGTDFAIPAKVSFVSPEAQFTPKQVETRSERDKLVFRVKLRVPPSLVERHVDQAKTGIRGTGYVRLGSTPSDWPEFLRKRFPGDPADAED
jgi:HlyD family secretion protein